MLTGAIHLNNSSGECARMNLRYLTESGSFIDSRAGRHGVLARQRPPLVERQSRRRTDSTEIGQVQVQLQTLASNGTYVTAGLPDRLDQRVTANAGLGSPKEFPTPLGEGGRMARLDKLDDSRLAARVGAGDEAAFSELYDRHHKPLLSFCRHMLGNVQDGEDALQQTFIRAHRALVGGSVPDAVRPWLFAIARNRCKTMLAARRDATVPVEDVEPSFDGFADDVARRADLRELVADMARLPEDQRGALVLFELGGMSQAEIATAIGVPAGQGQGARLPGADRADGGARRPAGLVHIDPRGARGRARRRAAARTVEAPPAPLRAVRRVPHWRSPRSAPASRRSCRSPRRSA